MPRSEATKSVTVLPSPVVDAPEMPAVTRKRRPRRSLAWTSVMAAVLAAGWFLKARMFPAQAANLTTAVVIRGDIEQTVLASGTLKPVNLVAVGAQVSGRITSLNVKLGEKIRKGDLVAEIDSLTQQNSLRSALAALDNTRAQRSEKEATLALAESALKRQQTTFAQKASSRADLETAQANMQTTQAQIAQFDAQIIQAEVAIATARINLGYTRITAPVDGTVLSIVTQEGQTVNAVQSAPTIVILGQLDVMTIRAEISEADVVRVRPGQNVYFTILGEPAHRYSANLRAIEPAPESVKSDSSFTSSTATATTTSSSTSSAIYYNGLFDVKNSEGRLRTYMTAEVHVVLGEARNALLVPSAALRGPEANGSYSLRVLELNGTVATRPVKVGLNNKISAQIVAGLTEGDRVVTNAADAAANKAGSPMPPGPF